MTSYGFAIDLRRCSGCGACALACKNENNVPDGMFWAHHITETVGSFPNVRYTFLPTLCNHCEEAPCVDACPLDPKVMHKDDDGFTLHDVDRCIGCRLCQNACPYGVISFNDVVPHPFWRDDTALIPGCTATPEEVVQKTGGNVIPYYNADRETTYPGIRPKDVVEKCTGCDHRVAKGLLPRCVETCPAKARFFGDLEDTSSDVSKMAALASARVLKPEEGTKPHVYYVGSFNPE